MSDIIPPFETGGAFLALSNGQALPLPDISTSIAERLIGATITQCAYSIDLGREDPVSVRFEFSVDGGAVLSIPSNILRRISSISHDKTSADTGSEVY